MEIGELNEKPLHAALKNWYAQPGDQLEVKVDDYWIDIVQDRLLVEIQTGNFSAIKRKLTRLTWSYPLRLVYPIAKEKWIVKLPEDAASPPTRRKSPKRGRVVDVFSELVRFPELLGQQDFSLEVLLIQEEEVRYFDEHKNWRRQGWGTQERRLLAVLESHLFETPDDFRALFSTDLPIEFTTGDLVSVMGFSKRLAQQAAYCLRKMGALACIGKRGRSNLYAFVT